jgi:integrase
VRGHIKKRVGKKCTSYDIVVSLGRDPITGKNKQKWETCRGTKKEAEKRLAELMQQINNGTYTDPGKITVAQYLARWLETYGKQNLAPATYRSYHVGIYKHIIPVIGQIPLIKLQPIHIQDLYSQDLVEGRKDNKKTTGKGLSPTTVLYHHRILHKALNQAVNLQLLNRNPADYIDRPKRIKKEIVILAEQEIKLLLNTLSGSYLYLPVFLAVYTGMRMGEILGLTWPDVDLNRGVIQVRQNLYQRTPGEPLFKQPKTPGSKRNIDISPLVVKTLREHKKSQLKERLAWGEGYKNYDLVCSLQNGDTINPPTLSSRFRVMAQRLGLFITFHGLRHVHASLLLKAGIPAKVVSDRLGHSQINITLDLYSHVMPGMQREASNKLEELLS